MILGRSGGPKPARFGLLCLDPTEVSQFPWMINKSIHEIFLNVSLGPTNDEPCLDFQVVKYPSPTTGNRAYGYNDINTSSSAKTRSQEQQFKYQM